MVVAHVANSLWPKAGVDVTVRQAWGGWPDPKMADVTYMNVRREAHGAAASLAAAYGIANAAL